MNVHMDCEGCEKRIRKAMSRLEGVSTVEIDMDMQKVTVTGYVERRRVLRAAEFWPSPYDAGYYPFAIRYLEDDTYLPTHRYHLHGYNDPVVGYYPGHAFTHILDDRALALFNDDNVHACTVM
ncbi:heavy metal-associated isoprenylated plant protein 45-like [Triticum dicoccoides]|uniref:heavy metal-associated isoprenylated plant protein 45-like n=1 Tax=Triticum dicoccoides TaxID=85692 RepID=UPI001890E462|nr:heavy metal-associated isoprenylated plant protein 45-like [Triticum dicoccoides]